MALSSSLLPLRGFHFEYSTNISLEDPRPACDLYILYILPPDVFVDKYELKERSVIFVLHGESDLERPLAAVGPAGSILEVQMPSLLRSMQIPLHARYPLPNASPYTMVRIPKPQGFWTCPTPRHAKENLHPFRHIPFPYVPSFDIDAWTITFLNQGQDARFHEVQVPTGRPADAMIVEFGTVFVVLAASFYVARAVWKTTEHLRQRTGAKRE